jgi:hypothetical protein
MTGRALRRLVTVRLSAGALRELGVAMCLEDGDGIGWTLCGALDVDGVGRTTFECPPDPAAELCSVFVATEPSRAVLDLVLEAVHLSSQSVIDYYG